MTDDERLAEIRELLCQRCNREYQCWFAPNEIWNRVIRKHGGDGYGDPPDRDHFLCPTCFTNLARERGELDVAWCVAPEDATLSAAWLERDRLLVLVEQLREERDALKPLSDKLLYCIEHQVIIGLDEYAELVQPVRRAELF